MRNIAIELNAMDKSGRAPIVSTTFISIPIQPEAFMLATRGLFNIRVTITGFGDVSSLCLGEAAITMQAILQLVIVSSIGDRHESLPCYRLTSLPRQLERIFDLNE